jgi:probable O-glycosylation ligase (exosortase A-associated)
MRDYVLTAFIFAILPVCVYRPWLGVIAWYWFGLMNPHRLTWGFAYTMPFAMLIGGATLLGLPFARDRRRIPWNAVLVLMVVLMAYFTFTTFFAWAPKYAWEEWDKVAKIVFMTFVATMFIYGHSRIRVLLLTVVISVGFFGVKGGIWAISTGGANQVLGPPDTFMDGNTFIGLAFNMVVPLMVILAREERSPWARRALYVGACLTIVATIFTYSRGAYLGLVVMLPLLFLKSRKKIIAGAILIPAVLLAPMVLPSTVFKRADQIETYEVDPSAMQRLLSWSVAYNIAKKNPLTGAGFEFESGIPVQRWREYGKEEYLRFSPGSHAAHSIYFQILGQHGFLALFAYVAMLISLFLSLRRTIKIAHQSADCAWVGSYASALQVGLVSFLVSGAFLSSAYFDLAWLYFALSAVLAREVKTSLPEAQRDQPNAKLSIEGA